LESCHITACKCVHLVTRGHFRSRNKDMVVINSIGHIQKPHADMPSSRISLTALPQMP